MQPDTPGEIRAALRLVLPPGIAISVANITGAFTPLAEAELVATVRMSPHRLQEFHAGRAQARLALQELGIRSPAVPVGPARDPQWPAGFVGSISHAGGIALAVAARTSVIGAIGIDLEPADPLDAELLRRVCRPEELARLGSSPELGAKLTFSAKESVYKCLAPRTGIFLEFEDVEVELDMTGQAFATRGHGPAKSLISPHSVVGRLARAGGFWLTAAWQWPGTGPAPGPGQRAGGV